MDSPPAFAGAKGRGNDAVFASQFQRDYLLVLRIAVALWSLLLAGGAWAQVSGGFGFVSDYRYRGVSLSDGKPAAQLTLAYDGAESGYAGVFASTADLGRRSSAKLQLLPYAGYARTVYPGLAWDLGLAYSAFVGDKGYDSYPEVYGGLATDHARVRLSYAPRYFGEEQRALYAELDGSQPLAEHLHLIAHLGYLRTERRGATREQTDFRAGVSLDLEQVRVVLSWVGRNGRSTAYEIGEPEDSKALVLSVTRPF